MINLSQACSIFDAGGFLASTKPSASSHNLSQVSWQHVKMDHPQNPVMTGLFHPTQSSSASWNGFPNFPRTPASASSSNNTYLLPSSPSKKPKMTNESYKPKIARTIGQRPACLVNASVTYCGNNQIYAFGGFDQYTDEGRSPL